VVKIVEDVTYPSPEAVRLMLEIDTSGVEVAWETDPKNGAGFITCVRWFVGVQVGNTIGVVVATATELDASN
jgi:hypothetical protein